MIKRIVSLIVLLLVLASPALAQQTLSTIQPVSQSGTFTVQAVESGSWLVQGMVASAGTNSGNPLKVGGVFNTTQPTVTNGQVVDAQTSARGEFLIAKGVSGFTIDNTSFSVTGTASANMAQVNGTTTDTNSGNKSAGTLRVVFATDQPQLTNKLLVTPDSVALPANQSVNEAQINGVAVTMGAGATGTGVQRVNDVASSATGAAPPASAQYIGGLGSGATGGFVVPITVCDTPKTISITTATTTLIVTGAGSQHVRICSIEMVTAIANNVALISGTGATCGTGTTGIAGGTTAANGWNFAANGGLTLGSGLGMVLRTTATGDSVCIITSAAGPLAGSISYAIY